MRLPMSLLNAMIPSLCHGCGEPLHQDDEYICPICASRMLTTGFMTTPGNTMEMRLAGRVPFERASAVYYYAPGSTVSNIVKDFKYRNFPSLAKHMGMRMFEQMCYCDIFNDVDAIVPMPIHWTRRLRRGYNQCEMMAQGLSERCGIPVATLLKTRRHSSQTRKSHKIRLISVDNLYYTVADASRWSGKHLLLIDDVCTTGATMVSAATALRNSIPGVRVSILTLCMTL